MSSHSVSQSINQLLDGGNRLTLVTGVMVWIEDQFVTVRPTVRSSIEEDFKSGGKIGVVIVVVVSRDGHARRRYSRPIIIT